MAVDPPDDPEPMPRAGGDAARPGDDARADDAAFPNDAARPDDAPLPDDVALPPEAARAVRLTGWAMWWEAVARAFWPAFVWAAAGIAALTLGLDDALPAGWPGPVVMVWLAILIAMIGVAAWRMPRPRRESVVARVDAGLPGRPLSALGDALAVGAGHPGSLALWRAHLQQMWQSAARARPSPAQPGLARRDPLALRLAAMTALVVALLFGAVNPLGQGVGAIASTFRGPPPQALPPPAGAGWEGWAAPPDYTRRPVIYLNALPEGEVLSLPEGSRLSFRLYGEATAIAQDIGTLSPDAPPEAPVFVAERSGSLTVGPRRFAIEVLPDTPPTVAPGAAPERRADGRLVQRFQAADDNGVTTAQAVVTLDLAEVDRSFGLAIAPEPREPVRIELPLPARGGRTEVRGNLVTDLSQHPWANLPVTISLTATDGIGQQGSAPPMTMVLPGRRFFDPLAAALIEVRRDLLWSRENAGREAELLRAISWQPEGMMEEPLYRGLQGAITKLEADELTPQDRDAMAKMLWEAAVALEDGGLSDALKAMQRAQQRLSEAIRNGASPDEIRRLMDELKQATRDYTQMLAEQGKEDSAQRFVKQQPGQTITGDQIQQMMDEIERLMNEGKMAEAQELLEQFNRMMENLQVREGQGGEGDPSSGRGGSSGRLAETLRDQQRLADEAMRQMQDEFMGRTRPGGGTDQVGRPEDGPPGGDEGQGQQDQGEEGQGQGQGQQRQGQGGGSGQGGPQGRGGEEGRAEGGQGDLAARQRSLRDALQGQRGMLPGPGTPEGDVARSELDRAGRAMEEAEQALRDGDMGGAMDRQAEAIEAMREGLRALGRLNGEDGERQAQDDEQGQEGGQDRQQGGTNLGQGSGLPYLPREQRDPLGRESGGNGSGVGTDDRLAETGRDPAARAHQLLDEIRRRSGEARRSTDERDYLRRLLDQF